MNTGSLVNLMYSNSPDETVPEIGMAATVLAWTDRYAGTVVAVDAKSFTVREDHAERTDKNGMSEAQDYAYTPNPNGRTWTFKRVARGKFRGLWREDGRATGAGVRLGARIKFHDFSF